MDVSLPLHGSNEAYLKYQRARMDHWDSVAKKQDHWESRGAYYHERIAEIYRNLVSSGQRVLEVGCGTGDLLSAVSPDNGVGIDFSPEMISRARKRHLGLSFHVCDAHEIDLPEQFDVIILSDIVNDLWDVQAFFQQLKRLCAPDTKIIINLHSQVWEFPFRLAQTLDMTTPYLPQNWLTVEDIANLLNLAGFETIRHWPEMLWPVKMGWFSRFMNRVLVKLWPLKSLAMTNFIIARRKPGILQDEEPVVSVIVPARNEAGNIEEIIRRTPEMGGGTELVFVEGNSQDNTYEAIEKAMAAHPQRRCRLFRQPGAGKGDAVRLGFQQASGEIFMILDADMTVPPESLPRFYEAIRSGKGEFINGVRLVYPMEEQAMRYLNLMGNKFFSLAFSWLLGQAIKDTLCGTKVLTRQNYEKIAHNRQYFGDFDPFGDFDLLFGAARLNLKITEMPIRYAERKYGATNIDRWRHGWLLLKMTLFAMKRIKLV
ncbi:MAG: glycosyltransferase [Desulfomonilia bacterium]|jgi:ubiquinone/menaquinone biosynthesis C-methylase UbiE|nr:glycosyltransferase [Desulfomonilia bacterium]